MENIQQTKTKLRFAVISLVTFVVLATISLVYINISRNLQYAIDQKEFESLITNEEALSAYYADQAGFEAHFIKSANIIKESQLNNLLEDTLMYLLPMILIAIVFSYYVSRFLINPIQESYDSKKRFMQDAAHELRNPLGAINATTQAILDDDEVKNNQLLTSIQGIQRQVVYLINLSNDLIFLEKSKNDKMISLNLTEVTQDVIDQLRHLANEENVNVSLKSNEKVEFIADIEDIVVLMRNLISNAIKYSKDKAGKVDIELEKTKRGIKISVKDDGIGINKDELEKIGSRFYRASNAQDITGSGLGLSIVKKIVKKYKGEINIDSEVGRGTTIIVRL
jgi:signal transduction histidine kinase